VGGRQPVRVFGVQPPARGRDCRTTCAERPGVDLCAASASDSTRDFVNDLFAPQPRNDAVGSGVVLSELLFGQTQGASFSDTEASAGAVFPADELLRSGILPGGGRPAAGVDLLYRQPAEGRCRTGGADHESYVWVVGRRGPAVTIVVKIGGAALEDA